MASAPSFDRTKPLDNEHIEDYFRALVVDASSVLKNAGIRFDFNNYTSTIQDFYGLNIDDTNKAWVISKDIAGWIEYLGDMHAYVQRALHDAETDKISIQSVVSKSFDDAKVNRGDRFANQDERVVEARKTRNTLEALDLMLDKKIKSLEKMHYFCKATWEINVEQTKE